MGISFDLMPFFDAVHECAGIKSPFVSLGSQQIQEQAYAVEAFSKEHGYHDLTPLGSLFPLLKQRYGVDEYDDIDLDGKSSIHLDLTQTISSSDPLWQKFATIYNGGTTEHIFDVAKTFDTIHNLMSIGGVCIHTSPLSWFTHGFYNFTMRFYEKIIQANNYLPIVHGYYFMTHFTTQDADILPKFYCTYRNDSSLVKENANHIERAIRSGMPIPQNTMICVSYKKCTAASFAIPYDIAFEQ